jgi:S1-C subfamily serine protease
MGSLARTKFRTHLDRRTIACAIAMLLAISVAPMRVSAVGGTPAVAAIRPAVVFIYLPLAQETGSGVVVHTDANGSDIVTAAHVVKSGSQVQVYFQNDLEHPHTATIVRVDADSDLALLRTKESAPSQASLAEDVASGQPVVVLGYPAATSVKLASKKGELQPEAIIGTITSVRSGGMVISTNAATEPGDSGAPIFKQSNAEIVGIVSGKFGSSKFLGYQGTGVAALRKFLSAAHIAFYGATGTQGASGRDSTGYRPVIGLQTLKEARGAHKFLADIITDVRLDLQSDSSASAVHNANQTDAVAFSATLRKTIASSLGQSFGATVSDDVNSLQNITALADLGRAAYERGYVGGVQEILAVHTARKSIGFVHQFEVSAKITIVDRYGDVVYSAAASKTQQQPLATFMQAQVEGVWTKAVDSVLVQIAEQTRRFGPDGGTNFARFGIPLATGQKSPLLVVEPDEKGARVTTLFPYGTAARSTLQLNDRIVALDGTDLKQMPADKLTAMFDNHVGSVFRCTVLEPDGQPVVVTFEAEDVRWYLEHPMKPKR